MPKFKNIAGQKFDRLTAIRPTEKRLSGHVVWECLCLCGNKCFASGHHLQSGRIRSCGCLKREYFQHTHGMSKTRTYETWKEMIQRCENPNNSRFKDYGGRGIKVCKRWHSFENFLENMGERPESKTLDRWPDNNGDYEPGNTRWATPKEQRINSRSISCGPRRQRWFYGHGPNGEMIIENNQHHIARIFDLLPSSISACLLGKQRQHRNWKFEFLKIAT